MVKTLDGRRYHAPTRMWTPFTDEKIIDSLKKFDPHPYLRMASGELSEPKTMPLMRETMEIRVDGTTLTVYKDDVQRELYKALYHGFFLPGG
jgi:hypothetical protein